MEAQGKKEMKKLLLKLWLIWGAALYILSLSIRLAFQKQNELPYFAGYGLSLPAIKYTFFVFALVALYFAFSSRSRWLKNEKSTYSEDILKRAKKFNKPAASLKYASDVIASIILSLICGFLGLVYFFLSKDLQISLVFIVISAIAILFFQPDIKEFDKYLAKDGGRKQ